MKQLENVITEKYFLNINFSDQREMNVFFSYLRGFSILFLDNSIKNILEIGAGQSTSLLSKFGQKMGWNLITIDMNPDSIELKLRNKIDSEDTLRNISFRKGVSISVEDIKKYYQKNIDFIGGIPFKEALNFASEFIETIMDPRKINNINKILNVDSFNKEIFFKKILDKTIHFKDIINIYRTPGNELDFIDLSKHDSFKPLLQSIMCDENIDVVFLDSGEFSSLPEWDIVESKLRLGGYVILHDIFFPKSFKNWLVAGSIKANPNYKIWFIDDTTPQGLLVAQKIK